jgi:hypothetical protein
MDIIINNEKIDFELSSEDNCFSIIDELRKWVNSKNHIVLEIKIDSDIYDSEKHGNLKENDITQINLKTEHIEILTINSLTELKKYSDRVYSYIVNIRKKPETFSDQKLSEIFLQLKDGFRWCTKAIDNIVKIIHKNLHANEEYQALFKSFNIKINSLEGIMNPGDIKKMFLNNEIEELNSILEKIVVYLYKKLQENKTLLTFDEILEGISDNEKMLKGFKDEIIEIAEKLQIGETVDAMNLLKEKFAVLEKVIALFNQIKNSISFDYENITINEKSLKIYIDEFLDLMKELLDSFKTQDYIMLADLLEYELNEFIDIFINSFSEIKNIVKNLKEAEGIEN